MKKILVIGAGKIGSLIAFLLARSHDYFIYLADTNPSYEHLKTIVQSTERIELVSLDANKPAEISTFLRKNNITAIASCLPYYCNVTMITLAKEHQIHYFDLTEDTETASIAAEAAQHTTAAFVPQCGLAPGFISIVATDLMQHFPQLDTVKMRVGALPINISNALQYSLTWSTDGLINEYGNFCQAIENGAEVNLLPLDGLEEIKIDGLTYEAFTTSGGIGTLVKSYIGKVKHLSYKTIRYPGHCEKMRFLMNDLKLNLDREILKRILERAIPKTFQDVVLVYVSVTGIQEHEFREENYVKKFYPQKIDNLNWSAIQLTTASAFCAVLDIVLHNPQKYRGLVRQEQFSLDQILKNRFGQYYA